MTFDPRGVETALDLTKHPRTGRKAADEKHILIFQGGDKYEALATALGSEPTASGGPARCARIAFTAAVTEGSNASAICCLKSDSDQMHVLLSEKQETTPLNLQVSSFNSTSPVFCNITKSSTQARDANVNLGIGVFVENTFGFLVELFPQVLYVLILTIRCILKSFYQSTREDSETVHLGPTVSPVVATMNLSVTVIEPASAPANGKFSDQPHYSFYDHYTQAPFAL